MGLLWRKLAVHLALSAMLLRALLPSGWMPAASLSGGTWLQVCDGMSHAEADPMAGMPGMPGMHHHHHPHHDPEQSNHEPCPFAGAAQLASAHMGPLYTPPARIGYLAWHDTRQAQSRPALRLEARAPRGPPDFL